MAEYKGIKGFKVQSLASDPTLVEGQVWYNTTGNVLKYQALAAGSWAAGGTRSSYYSGAYSGTQTAGVYGSGTPGPTATTDIYDGTSWTTSPATLGQARHHITNAGCGTSTAAQITGGEKTPYAILGNTEQFDGTSWAEVNDMVTGRYTLVVGGTQAGAIGMTGYGPGVSALVEEWDGTSWTAGTAAPTATYYAAGGGTQTSAIVCGGKGSPPPRYNISDYWNGTSWTETANMNSGRTTAGTAAESGTAALVFGGEEPPRVAKTEYFDGTSWTEVADLATANNQISGGGSATVGISCAGESPNSGETEEWTWTALAVKTVTVS